MLYETEFDRDIERFGKMVISEFKRKSPELEGTDFSYPVFPLVVDDARLKRYFTAMKLRFQGDIQRTELCFIHTFIEVLMQMSVDSYLRTNKEFIRNYINGRPFNLVTHIHGESYASPSIILKHIEWTEFNQAYLKDALNFHFNKFVEDHGSVADGKVLFSQMRGDQQIIGQGDNNETYSKIIKTCLSSLILKLK